MVIVLDVTVAGDAHAALDVIINVTLSPFTRVDEVKVDEVDPAFAPLTCHW